MTKLEIVFRELGQLYEFNKAIRPYRIKSDRLAPNVEKKHSKESHESEARLNEALRSPSKV